MVPGTCRERSTCGRTMKQLPLLGLISLCLVSACTGPMRRMDRGISGDAGTIFYQYSLKSCPVASAELPSERSSQFHQLKADTFYSPNGFVKKMRYCHGFTKYSFEEHRDKDRFYVFSAYVRIDRTGPSCSLQIATPAEFECSNDDARECAEVKEQEAYMQTFVDMLLLAAADQIVLSSVSLFRSADDWESWCHKRSRLKTYR